MVASSITASIPTATEVAASVGLPTTIKWTASPVEVAAAGKSATTRKPATPDQSVTTATALGQSRSWCENESY
jgi:hypothetical protein